MMSTAFEEAVRRHLPLRIDRVEGSEDHLSLSGEGWSFHTSSPWRIVGAEGLRVGCEEDRVEEQFPSLVGKAIHGVGSQSAHWGLDPFFALDDGTHLEVFSCQTFEPWTMSLPEGPIWTAP